MVAKLNEDGMMGYTNIDPFSTVRKYLETSIHILCKGYDEARICMITETDMTFGDMIRWI